MDVNTPTPTTPTTEEVNQTVDTPAIEEVNQTIETPTTSEVNTTVEPNKKKPSWMPYGVYSEKVKEYNDLRRQWEDAQVAIKGYNEWQKILSDNPDFAEGVRQLWQQYFNPDQQPQEDLTDVSDYETRLKKIEEDILLRQKAEIQTKFENELSSALEQSKKDGIPITREEIMRLMLDNEIASPLIAYNVLVGQKLSDIKKGWESQWTQTLKSTPQGTPSTGGIQTTLQTKRPTSLDEAAQMALKDNRKMIIEK
ncbi:MAG: hypothetical protein AB1567_04515 [bacterium]